MKSKTAVAAASLPRPIPHSGATVFFVLLLGTAVLLGFVWVLAFFVAPPWSWSVGLVYIVYDTWLLSTRVQSSRRAIRAQLEQPVSSGVRKKPTLTVLTAARDEAASLPATLNALIAQSDKPERIVVIDDGSIDTTEQMLIEHYDVRFSPGAALGTSALCTNLRVLKKSASGKADSLNQALRLIDTDLVVTLDADTVLEADAVAAIRQSFSDTAGLTAACGVLTPVCRSGFWGPTFGLYQTFEYLRGFLWRLAWMNEKSLVLVSGAFAAFRTDALRAVGGWDPHSRVEDYELLFRLHRYGFDHGTPAQVHVIGTARATTDAPATPRAFLRQRTRWFAGYLETMFKNRDMVGVRRFGSLGSFHLIVKTLDMMLPLYGLSAFSALLIFLALRTGLDRYIFVALVAKFVFDLGCHTWALALHEKWQGRRVTARLYFRALAASLSEPYAFQVFRQLAALLGWLAFLRGRIDWKPQRPHQPTIPQIHEGHAT